MCDAAVHYLPIHFLELYGRVGLSWLVFGVFSRPEGGHCYVFCRLGSFFHINLVVVVVAAAAAAIAANIKLKIYALRRRNARDLADTY